MVYETEGHKPISKKGGCPGCGSNAYKQVADDYERGKKKADEHTDIPEGMKILHD